MHDSMSDAHGQASSGGTKQGRQRRQRGRRDMLHCPVAALNTNNTLPAWAHPHMQHAGGLPPLLRPRVGVGRSFISRRRGTRPLGAPPPRGRSAQRRSPPSRRAAPPRLAWSAAACCARSGARGRREGGEAGCGGAARRLLPGMVRRFLVFRLCVASPVGGGCAIACLPSTTRRFSGSARPLCCMLRTTTAADSLPQHPCRASR